MEPIASSETSAIRTQMPGNYPKRNKLRLEHSESLKTRIILQYSEFNSLCVLTAGKNPLLTQIYHYSKARFLTLHKVCWYNGPGIETEFTKNLV